MKPNTILSLKDAQHKKKMEKNNFYRWLEREKIALYFKVPEGKNTFIASRKFLDMLIRGASSDELQFHKLRGGIEQAEIALSMVWLKIPRDAYKTLFASGVCRLHYFFEGLQPSEDGLKSVRPRFVNKYPFGLKPLPLDAIYCLTDTLSSPLPAQNISIDDVSIDLEALLLLSKSPSSLELPTYRYASRKLEIALQVWSDIWKKHYARLNDKALTDRKSIDKTNEEASIAAKRELEKIYKSNDFKGEKYENLHSAISKIIHPNFSPNNPNQWFDTPISRGIIAMIDASNYFWADPTAKEYGVGLERSAIVDYLLQQHCLNSSDADKATRIIQPDNITRGRRRKT